MRTPKKSEKEASAAFKWLMRIIRPHWLWLFTAAILVLASGAISAVRMYIMGDLVNSVMLNDSFWSATTYTFFALSISLIPLKLTETFVTGRLGAKSGHTLRKTLCGAMLNARIDELDARNSGEFVSKLTGDITGVQDFLNGRLPQFAGMAVSIIGTFIACFALSWQLSLGIMLLTPLLMLGTMALSKPMFRLQKEVREAGDRCVELEQDGLSAPEVVKSFTLESILGRRHQSAVGMWYQKQEKSNWTYMFTRGGAVVIGLFPMAFIAVIGGLMVLRGSLSVGYLSAFLIAMGGMVNTVMNFGEYVGAFQQSMAQAGRIKEAAAVRAERDGGYAGDAEPAISFDEVTFAYEGKMPLFESLTFSVAPGEKVAFAGPSGCGKSTVFQILTGFYEKSGGDILIGGRRVEDWDVNSMRGLLAVVSQDTYLFPASILENVRYGKPDATDAEVREAIRAAGLSRFVESLPDGLDTQVGERGAELSGGQRQRVSIARALLKDAPILLLDEPTSALDLETEHALQQELDRLMEGRTSIIIAHRLSTIQGVDRILCMSGGKIAESGTHDELMRKGGLYSQLYRKQTGPDNGALLNLEGGELA